MRKFSSNISKIFLLLCVGIIFIPGCGKKSSDNSVEVLDNDASVDFDTTYSSADYSESENFLYSYTDVFVNSSDDFYVSDNLAFSMSNNGKLCLVSTANVDGDNKLLFSNILINGSCENTFLELPNTNLYVSTDETEMLKNVDDASLSVSVSFDNFFINDNSIVGLVDIYYNCSSFSVVDNAYSYVSLLCTWSLDGDLTYYNMISDDDAQKGLNVYKSFNSDNKYVLILSDGQGGYNSIVFNYKNSTIENNIISKDSDVFVIDDVIKSHSNYLVSFYKDNDGITQASYFDIDNLSIGNNITLPDYISLNGYSDVTFSDSDQLIFSNYTGVYSYDMSSGEFKELLDYVNSDFTGYYISNINFSSDNCFFGLYTSIYDGSVKVAYFKPSDDRNESKSIVILGTYKLSVNARKHILKYNSSDNLYRVMIEDYSLKDTVSNPKLGYETMNSDLLNATGPDFVLADISEIDVNILADNSRLVSWNYLTNLDSDFSSQIYLTNVLDAYAVNGYDYVFVYDFIYRTYLGNADVLGNKNSFSIKTFKNKAVNSKDVELYSEITQDDYLDTLIKYDAEDFIDTIENTSEFNCDEFITLLEYAKKLPTVVDSDSSYSLDELYRNGGILLREENIVSADGFWDDAYRYFDGGAVVAGFPSDSSYNSIVEYVDFPFLIAADGNIAGAWDVVKTFYSYDFQSNISNAIPVNSYAFDDWGNYTLYYSHYSSYAAAGDSEYLKKTYYYNGKDYEIPFITTDNISKIKDTVTYTKKSAFSNNVIYNIIWEEAENYLSGNQTAKEAASNMDDRITNVLNGI